MSEPMIGSVTLKDFLHGTPVAYEGFTGAACVVQFKHNRTCGVSYLEVSKDGKIVSEPIMSQYSAASFFLSLGLNCENEAT